MPKCHAPCSRKGRATLPRGSCETLGGQKAQRTTGRRTMSPCNLTPWVLVVSILLPVQTLVAQNVTDPLPEPTGVWRVGRVTAEVVDTSRRMPDGHDPRGLMLHIWYPASPGSRGAPLPYVEHLEAAGSLLADDELSLLKTVRTHSFAAPAAAPPRRGFPLLLFSHGEQMNAFLYSSLNEELASHGFVVVAVDHPDAALFAAYPDGTVVPYSQAGQDLRARVVDRAADLRFVRDQVSMLDVGDRRLKDLVSGRVGVFGHSNGGIAAALMCQQAPVVDACLNLDGRLDGAPVMTKEGVPPPSRPFMYLTKPFRALTDAELRAEGITRDQATKEQADTWARDGRLLSGGAPPSYRVTLNQAAHESFSDEPLLREPGDESNLKLMSTVRGLVVEFFDTELNGPERKLAASRSAKYVEVELLARKPVP